MKMGINTTTVRAEHAERRPDPVQDSRHVDDEAIPANPNNDDDDSNGRRRQQWADVASVINLAVRGAFPASPAFDAGDPGAFQAHWRAVFAWLHDCVAADAGIATQLADPPLRRFEIRILDDGGGSASAVSGVGACDDDSGNDSDIGCPCRLLPKTAAPSIVLRNDRGVTKVDLVRGLSRYLYGSDQPPLVYRQQGPAGRDDCSPTAAADDNDDDPPLSQQRGPALPYEAGWMGSYDGIWVYCCPPDQFASRIRDERDAAASGAAQSNNAKTDRASMLHSRGQQRAKTRLRL
ncbi:hypothetical protein GGTG_09893 [Gaeumannomyces tritici R3-111a-1]|uniref:Uncharacterized protein n=1 Tax=Gaeumannomyces tritici (strain R3-111a-1) TaxID=644352 RepID=J3P8Q8_GAET3|nr:hypothetical protein GGTG_09893 [Gaeumannomyces tritici R3-111a-1]EJT73042.1 hypothetical protein GGTG_09893 [Gaeumannomyces tritici R3-111a-1]